jgi:glycosyltransferase involved in cell wall biosynthesis
VTIDKESAGSLPELIEDRVSGLLVAAGDSVDLAMTLRRLAKDSELRDKLGEAARRQAKNQFSISRYVRDMEQLYADFGSGGASQ